ncbi:hypothetical protein ACVWYQ_003377 [Bradyrhizobium sp. USDA 3397]
MPSVFFSYSHSDEALRDQLEKQLALLKRQGVIEVWHDRRIGAGQEFAAAIDQHVETDDIILLLVSSDFLASDYCYEKEMLRAMERHEAGEAIVIPVILRACDWHGAPFGKLNATPRDGKPITQYADRDEAMLEVARAVRAAAERRSGSSSPAPKARAKSPAAPLQPAGPRSSNLRLAKQFTDRDKDQFRIEGFDYIARYFENSIAELAARNPGIEATFRKIDANRFTAKTYKNGQNAAQCTIFMGGAAMAHGIAYLSKETSENNSYNEMLTAEADDQSLYFRSMGLSMTRSNEREKLSPEGAAELYWSMFIEPLQHIR